MIDQWMPREQWDALVRGDDCPLCAAVRSTELADDLGYTISDLRISRFRLVRNQFVPGYCVLICSKHVIEPYQLSPEDRVLFFDDMLRAAQALELVFKPIKMNYEILGNAVPHLHAHLVPRYYGDPAPSRPIDAGAQTLWLTEEEYQIRVLQLREALRLQ